MKRVIALAATGAMAVGLVALPAVSASAAPVPAQRAQVVSTYADGSIGTVSRPFVDHGALTIVSRDRQSRRPGVDKGVQITVVSVNRGHNIRQVQAAINLQLRDNATPAQAALSTRLINAWAQVYGGVDNLPRSRETRSTTVNLDHAGRYYVINTETGRADVVGRFFAGFNTAAVPNSVVSSTSVLVAGFHGVDRFFGSNGVLPRSGVIDVRNLGDTVHLVEIYRVRNGVTDRQVQREFDTILANRVPLTDPAGLNSTPTNLIGTDAIGAGHSAKLRYRLGQGGTYLVLCFVADGATGIPHAFMGMHKILHFA